MAPLSFSRKVYEKFQLEQRDLTTSTMEADVDIDLGEVYFLIMHFLSAGPCHNTFGHLLNELLEHQLLPRRYHAWYSRGGLGSGEQNDNGLSFPLSYNGLVDRFESLESGNSYSVRNKGKGAYMDVPPWTSPYLGNQVALQVKQLIIRKKECMAVKSLAKLSIKFPVFESGFYD
ncbi:hypothetical protein ACLOJK_017650 [Asimina triloba]